MVSSTVNIDPLRRAAAGWLELKASWSSLFLLHCSLLRTSIPLLLVWCAILILIRPEERTNVGVVYRHLLYYRMAEDLSQFDLSVEEKDKLVAEVIRYILFKTHQNSGCPIKRDELTQLITKNYRQRALPTLVINEAKQKLSSIFGYEMRELQRTRPSSTNTGRASQQSVADVKSYIITSQLPSDVYKKYVEDINTKHMIGFTFVVISIVRLSGDKITEESLWQHLRRMGLDDNDESHKDLGNTKQALEALVQQRYLQKEKVSGPEGHTTFYALAERATDGMVLKEVDKLIPEIAKKDVGPVDAD